MVQPLELFLPQALGLVDQLLVLGFGVPSRVELTDLPLELFHPLLDQARNVLGLGREREQPELVFLQDHTYFKELPHFLFVLYSHVLETLLHDLFVVLLVLDILVVVIVLYLLQHIHRYLAHLENLDVQTDDARLVLFVFQ